MEVEAEAGSKVFGYPQESMRDAFQFVYPTDHFRIHGTTSATQGHASLGRCKPETLRENLIDQMQLLFK
jgi:hypothetical protein